MPPLTQEALYSARVDRRPMQPIDYNTAATQYSKLEIDYTVDHLLLNLSGILNVTSAVTYKLGNALALIREIRVVADGNRPIVILPGWLLAILGNIWERRQLYISDAATTTGNKAFEYELIIPFEVGRKWFGAVEITSPLNLFGQVTKVNVEVDWDPIANVISAGAATVTSATLKLEQLSNVQEIPTAPGAITQTYMVRNLLKSNHDIVSTRPDYTIELSTQYVWLRAVLATTADGVLRDDIINAMTLRSGQLVYQSWKYPRNLQLENARNYNFPLSPVTLKPTPITGIYVLEFPLPGSGEQMMAFRRAQSFDLISDVTKQGTDCRITMISDVFRNGQSALPAR